jgi:MFS transporter, DHA1 family, multidrug resistance protein
MGFVGGNQVNAFLLRKFDSQTILSRAYGLQVVTGWLFLGSVYAGGNSLMATLVLFFICLSCIGVIYPNAAALSLAPFSKNAGSASALLGVLQLGGVGAVISTGIGLFHSHDSRPIIAILSITAAVGAAILVIGRKQDPFTA